MIEIRQSTDMIVRQQFRILSTAQRMSTGLLTCLDADPFCWCNSVRHVVLLLFYTMDWSSQKPINDWLIRPTLTTLDFDWLTPKMLWMTWHGLLNLSPTPTVTSGRRMQMANTSASGEICMSRWNLPGPGEIYLKPVRFTWTSAVGFTWVVDAI